MATYAGGVLQVLDSPGVQTLPGADNGDRELAVQLV